jgi:dihydroorotase
LSETFDLVVRGGRLAQDGLKTRSVAVKEGKIAALLDPGEPAAAREILDVAGCIVLPGLVDAHVHFREPGLTHKEDFDSGSRAAALGGVTTVMVMPTDSPMTQTPDQFVEKRRLGEARSRVDFALQALLGPDPAHVKALAALGAISFEIFLGFLGPGQKIGSHDELVTALQAVRGAGAVAGVTPFDDALAAMAPSLPPEVEAAGVARALRAHAIAGGRIHLRQISSALGLRALALAGAGVTSEVTPHNLWLTDEALVRLGAVAKVVPPLRPQADVAAVRAALAAGRISIVATDHAPHTPEEKEAGVAKAPGGFPGVQTMLPLLLKLVAEGVLTYEALVRVACEAPARIFGLYPQKGALAPGSDADLVIVDAARPMQIRNSEQASKAGRTPFDGWSAPATPLTTFLRGEMVANEGRILGKPQGRFLRPRTTG